MIEILITITLLSLIVLGLLIMFNQTSRAFKLGLNQTDSLENGRALMDLLVREVEQMTPSHGADWPPNAAPGFRGTLHAINFCAAPDPSPVVGAPTPALPTLLQYVPGMDPTKVLRTNITQHFFFLTQINQDWVGTGYEIVHDTPYSPVGALYRYCMTNNRTMPPAVFLTNFYDARNRVFVSGASSNRIADGVVHLHLRAFDRLGLPLVPAGTNSPTWRYWSAQGLWSTNVLNSRLQASMNAFGASATPYGSPFGAPWDETDYVFWSNAVPASVELELGLFEPRIIQRYKAIGSGTPAGYAYLSNNIGQVHLFRQRIPIRNVDLTAYP